MSASASPPTAGLGAATSGGGRSAIAGAPAGAGVAARPAREARAFLVFVAALVFASWLAHGFEGSRGTLLLWPPAAVIVLYLVRRTPLWLTIPAVAFASILAGLVTGLASSAPQAFDVALVVGTAVALGHGAGAAVFRFGRRRSESGSANELLWFAVGLVVVGPGLAAVGARWAGTAMQAGVDGAGTWEGVFALAVADAVAVAAFVPLVLARGGWPDVPSAFLPAVAVASLGGAAAWGSLSVGVGSDVLVLVAAIPMIAAAVLYGRAAAVMAVAATALGMLLGLVDTPAEEVVGIQAGFVAMAAVTLILGAMRSEPLQVRAQVDEQGITLASLGTEVRGLMAYREAMARGMRAIRWAAVGLLALHAANAVLLGAQGGVRIPVVLLLVVMVPLPLAVNLLSLHWDRTRVADLWRARLEVGLDVVVLGVLYLAFTGDNPLRDPTLVAMLVGITAALRLPRPWHVGVTAAFTTFLAAYELVAFGPLFVVAPDYTPLDGLLLVLTTTAVSYGIGGAVGKLLELHQAGLAATRELDAAQRLVSEQQEALRAEHERTRARALELATTVGELDEANEALAASRAELERFASVVAHDLRSPIATSASLAETLTTLDLPAAQMRQVASRIAPGLHRALALMDRLHRHARATTSDLQAEVVDLNPVVRHVLDDLSVRTTAVGATVSQTTLLPRLACDKVLVGQALANLIGNALRYAVAEDGEGPTIHISGRHTDDGFVLTVEDDGPGIPADEAEGLFERGARGVVDDAGIGLGLATCRDIVTRHGGRIWAHPSRLGGAGFSMAFPDVVRAIGRVLLVEDEEAMRALFRYAIESSRPGVVVDEASGVQAAIARLTDRQAHYDVVVLDLALPDGDGIEVLEVAQHRGIPVHVITANAAAPLEELRRQGARVSDKVDMVRRGEGLADQLLGAAIGS